MANSTHENIPEIVSVLEGWIGRPDYEESLPVVLLTGRVCTIPHITGTFATPPMGRPWVRVRVSDR